MFATGPGDGSLLVSSSCNEPELSVDFVLGNEDVLELKDSSLPGSFTTLAKLNSPVVSARLVGGMGGFSALFRHHPRRATYMSAPFKRGCFFRSVKFGAEHRVWPLGRSNGSGCGGPYASRSLILPDRVVLA